jgi:hypothetical protein
MVTVPLLLAAGEELEQLAVFVAGALQAERVEKGAFERFAACGDSGFAAIAIVRKGDEVAGGAVHVDRQSYLLALVISERGIISALKKIAERRAIDEAWGRAREPEDGCRHQTRSIAA